MKNIKNFTRGKRLVKTFGQAKTALSILMQDSEKLNLERGISVLIDKLKNPKLDLLLDRYPDLLQEYDLEQLLSGSLEITDTKIQDVKIAGLLSCLQLLIHFCHELRSNPNPDYTSFAGLRHILNSITSSQFVNEILLLVISVVGKEYYEKFQLKIKSVEFGFEQSSDLDNDPELQEHLELMLWLALVRLFLESVYIYFNNPDQNLKNTML